MHTRKTPTTALAGASLALALAGCGQLPATTGTAQTVEPPPAQATAAASPTKALDLLDTIPVKGRAPETGYDRDKFGSGWTDTNDNGCGTRQDILARDLVSVEYEGAEKCEVASGVLPYGPYTGEENIKFDADGGYDLALDTEHIAALGDAWQKGAQQWTETRREQFANDPANLMMVDPSLNRAKGAADAATWLPPNKAYRCTYVTKQTMVKAKYDLWMTAAEHAKITDLLTNCTIGTKGRQR
ncbi:HNH endonuclease family protein [Arthrobacter castelli]|uniref:HNH endonuclease family protein n=1 Tax=Arthrobacter castelli TaxID=271431 RepID=UPI000406F279|nr:HNH endonuclease family protein [Arthrobacter castelli]